MQEGDMVIDLDYIKQSISLRDKTDADDNLLPIAIGIRDYLYDKVRDRDIESNVWIVVGMPRREDRARLKDYIKVDDVIYIDATYKQCIDRAMNDIERKDKDIQKKIIDKWFEIFYEELV